MSVGSTDPSGQYRIEVWNVRGAQPYSLKAKDSEGSWSRVEAGSVRAGEIVRVDFDL